MMPSETSSGKNCLGYCNFDSIRFDFSLSINLG
jgi:hypothetical protein